MTGKMRFWAILLGVTIAFMLLVLVSMWAASTYGKCGGEERWNVKTLQDGFVPAKAVMSTIEKEVALPAPAAWSGTLARQPLEKKAVAIKCNLVAVGIEADSDFHLVLSDGTHTMIGEIPRGQCASPKYAKTFDDERTAVVRAIGRYPHAIHLLKTPIAIAVTGVQFFDKPNHNGAGHAKSEIELHPLLDFQCVK